MEKKKSKKNKEKKQKTENMKPKLLEHARFVSKFIDLDRETVDTSFFFY